MSNLTLTPNPESKLLSKEEEAITVLENALQLNEELIASPPISFDQVRQILSTISSMKERIKELEEMVGNFNLRTDLTLKRISELEAENENLKGMIGTIKKYDSRLSNLPPVTTDESFR